MRGLAAKHEGAAWMMHALLTRCLRDLCCTFPSFCNFSMWEGKGDVHSLPKTKRQKLKSILLTVAIQPSTSFSC